MSRRIDLIAQLARAHRFARVFTDVDDLARLTVFTDELRAELAAIDALPPPVTLCLVDSSMEQV